MARASSVVLTYLVVGIVMFGGGIVEFTDAGLINYFANPGSGGTFITSGEALGQLETAGGSLSSVVSLAVGMVLVVWRLVVDLLSFFHWPVLVLNQVNAPPTAVLLLGFTPVAAFYLAVLRVLRLS